MSKRSYISAVEGESQPMEMMEQTETVETSEFQMEVSDSEEWEDDDFTPRSWMDRTVPALSVLCMIAWTGFYVWINRGEMLDGDTPQQWAEWIIAWTIPILLIISLWMLASRNSMAETRRFGKISRSLAEETAHVESRMAAINREISLAREFLSSQSRELETLGRSATERLSEHASQLQDLVHDNGTQIDSIANVSNAALENMNRLRDNLPVIANSAKDVSNQIAGAGHNAQEQFAQLVKIFERLNASGTASEQQITALQASIDSALETFVKQARYLDKIATERFAALREGTEKVRADLAAREMEALAAIRTRSEKLRDELAKSHQTASAEEELALATMRKRVEGLRDEAATISNTVREGEATAINTWTEQVEAMKNRFAQAISEVEKADATALNTARTRLIALYEKADALDQSFGKRAAALDEVIAERNQAQSTRISQLSEQSEALITRVGELHSVFSTVSDQGKEAGETLAGAISSLKLTLRESREELNGTDEAVASLTNASVRLLELIQASAQHSREDLPLAMETSEDRLSQIESRTVEIRELLEQARISGDHLTQGMTDIEQRTRNTMEGFEDFQSGFGETAAAQIDSVERLRAGVLLLRSESEQLAEKIQGELHQAISVLETSARHALHSFEAEEAAQITQLAKTIGDRSTKAIDKALAEHTEAALSKLDEARKRMNEASISSTKNLQDQLARLNEITANLETRIAHARDKASDSVDGDFSRRMVLITEGLNSHAIDITKALSNEVTDTAWESYLRGDRSIFTRRAVRLISKGEARQIAEFYDTDPSFREHVNRYIHDFESMLRNMLSTRDGNAFSVTLLSSDMGKLYVILAQALERLRQ